MLGKLSEKFIKLKILINIKYFCGTPTFRIKQFGKYLFTGSYYSKADILDIIWLFKNEFKLKILLIFIYLLYKYIVFSILFLETYPHNAILRNNVNFILYFIEIYNH